MTSQFEGVLAQAAAPGAAGGSMTSTLIFVLLMVGIFYLMLFRPQQKQAKQHREMLSALKKGDVVVTNGGIVGRVHLVAPKFVVLEAGRDLRLRVLTTAIQGKAPEGMMDEEPKAVEGEPSKAK